VRKYAVEVTSCDADHQLFRFFEDWNEAENFARYCRNTSSTFIEFPPQEGEEGVVSNMVMLGQWIRASSIHLVHLYEVRESNGLQGHA
jgi:hypothetical protein